jgi:hypothetical protein
MIEFLFICDILFQGITPIPILILCLLSWSHKLQKFMASNLQEWKPNSSNYNQQKIFNSTIFNSSQAFKCYILALE